MLSFRNTINPDDVTKIKELLVSTGFFEEAPDEIDVATELAELSIRNGNNIENYEFIFAEDNSIVVGYVCFARIPCTISSFEIYWICVDKNQQGKGIGKKLITEVIAEIKKYKARKLLLHTAGRNQYIPTQMFYESYGFKLEGRLKNYYDIGDDDLIYSIDF